MLGAKAVVVDANFGNLKFGGKVTKGV